MVADGAATAELLERIANEAGDWKCLPVAGCGRWMVADGAATAELLERIASEAGDWKCLPVAGCGRWMVADGAATAELLEKLKRTVPLERFYRKERRDFVKI